MSNNIKKQLNKVRVNTLTQQEKEAVWKQVCLSMAVAPEKTTHKIKTSSIIRKSVAITLIFGMSMTTASAANNAKPGDFLFPLDRAIEDAQLSMTSNDKKDDLKVKFALERVEEVKEILGEISTKTVIKEVVVKEPEISPPEEPETTEAVPTPENDSEDEEEPKEVDETNPSGGTAESAETTELVEVASSTSEAVSPEEVFTASSSELEISGEDESPLLENGSTTTEVTPKTEEPKAEETVQKITKTEVEMSDVDKKRIELALGTALDFLGDVKEELDEQGNTEAASSIDNLLKDLNSEIETLPENITFEVKLSPGKQKVQFEITSEDDKEVVQLIKTPAEKAAETKKVETDEEPKEETVADDETIEPEIVEPKESKLEIKDGILTINKNELALPTEEEVLDEENSTTKEGEEESPEDVLETDTEEKAETEEGNATTTEDVSAELQEGEVKKEEDGGTTTVKVIIKKLEEDIEFSITDQDGDLHEIIEKHTSIREDA